MELICLETRIVWLAGSAGEVNTAFRKEVKHQGAALAHRGAMRRTWRINKPASRTAVKLGITDNRHDQVNLAKWVRMVRAGNVLHVHHID